MRLTPAFIFVEKSNDPIIGRILTKLAPKLKAIGYECFFDKTPRGSTLEEQIALIEKNEQIYNELEKQFQAHNLDISNKQHLEKFVLLTIMSMGISLVKYSTSDFLINIGQLIDHHSAALTFKTFLQTLAKNQIQYEGIDFRHFEKAVSLTAIYAYGKFRQEGMADLYLNSSQSVFGRVELAQAMNIQNDLLRKISLEEASARFCFFNINSDLSSENNENLSSLPFAFISIDAKNKTDDQIVSMIVKKIIEKQAQFNEFVMKQNLSDEMKQINFEQFKEAYFTKYNNTSFFFKNPMSKMKKSLENGEVNSMEDVVKYVEAYPNTRTADVIREFKLSR